MSGDDEVQMMRDALDRMKFSFTSYSHEVMRELRPIAEEWAGVQLVEGQAYGVRVYKNGSTLVNHVDRSETHVISCIFHIGHDLDEPW